jgi:hypothetical protein
MTISISLVLLLGAAGILLAGLAFLIFALTHARHSSKFWAHREPRGPLYRKS